MVLASRIVLALLGALGAVQAGVSANLLGKFASSSSGYVAFGTLVVAATAIGWLVGGIAGRAAMRGARRVERATSARSAGELTVGAVGLLVGLVVSALLYFPVHSLPFIGRWLLLPLFLGVGYVFALTAAKQHRGILRLVGVQAGAEPGAAAAGRGALVDTSVFIDGRIADIAPTGFLGSELVVPQFVLRELQRVADSGDPGRRARGRRGLEVVQELRSHVRIATPETDFAELDDVDAKLVKLARQRGLPILTTDYNLNRLARIQDVLVLNVNELANALKPAVLPGERLRIRLIREGKELDQAVGYLDDGTMVVVEGARSLLGETVEVAVTSVLQSPSGKMIFTRLPEP